MIHFRLHNVVNIKVGTIHKNMQKYPKTLAITCFLMYSNRAICLLAFYAPMMLCTHAQGLNREDRMRNKYSIGRFNLQQNPIISTMALTIVWVSGILIGAMLANKTSAQLSGYTLFPERTTFLGLLISAILPLVISAIVIKIRAPILILPIAFIKSFSYSYTGFLLYSFYGDAGWLAEWLCLFSDPIVIVSCLWFWLKNISAKSIFVNKDLLICSFISFGALCIDYFIVSPFSVMLFNYS